jgi:hypothetical protein
MPLWGLVDTNFRKRCVATVQKFFSVPVIAVLDDFRKIERSSWFAKSRNFLFDTSHPLLAVAVFANQMIDRGVNPDFELTLLCIRNQSDEDLCWRGRAQSFNSPRVERLAEQFVQGKFAVPRRCVRFGISSST